MGLRRIAKEREKSENLIQQNQGSISSLDPLREMAGESKITKAEVSCRRKRHRQYVEIMFDVVRRRTDTKQTYRQKKHVRIG